jgi:SPP1 gp7 family putative phage head morphogenesis protein
MSGAERLETIVKYDRALAEQEASTIARVNERLEQSYAAISQDLTTYYEQLQTEGSLAAQLQVRRSEELSGLLSQVAPDGFYDLEFELLTSTASDYGSTLGDELLKSYGAQSVVGSFATIPYAALVNQAAEGVKRLSNHTDTFASNASAIIEQGLIRGQGAKWMQRQLEQQFGVVKHKAETIARTEASSAFNAAAQQRYAAADIKYVQLLITPSDRVCPFCAGRNGAVFELGKLKVPLHPRCRCMILPYDKAWSDAGLTDDAFVIGYHDKGVAELRKNGMEPDYDGQAPFEKANKVPAPKTVWTPRGKDASKAKQFVAGESTVTTETTGAKTKTKKTTTKKAAAETLTKAKKAAKTKAENTAKLQQAAEVKKQAASKKPAETKAKTKAEAKPKEPAKPKLTADQKFIQKYSEQTKTFRAKNNELKKQLADGLIDDRKYRKERDKISSAIQKQTKEIEAELLKRFKPVSVSVGTKHGMTVAEDFLKVTFDDIDFYATEYKPGWVAIDDITEWIQDGWFPDSLKKHTKNVYFSNQRNSSDSYWEIKYNMPDFKSAATGGDGDVVVYNGEMIGHGSAAHEMAHNLANAIYGTTTPPRTSDFGKAAFNTKSPTEYGNSSDAEDFAESMRLYIRINNGLENESTKDFRENYPDRHRIMQKLIDDPNYKG